MSDYELSIKNDIVPTIALKLEKQVDPNILFHLPVDVLDYIFGLLYQDSTITPSTIADVILRLKDTPERIIETLEGEMQETMDIPSNYDEREDIIAGILVNVIEEYVGTDLKKEIERRLREITDVNKLIELSQVSLPVLEVKIGLRPPPSIPSTQESSVRDAPPPRVIRPGDSPSEPTAIPNISATHSEPIVPFIPPSPNSSTPSTRTIPSPTSAPPKPNIDPQQQKIIEERKKKAAEIVKDIEKSLSKLKLKPENLQGELDILRRIHPDRLVTLAKNLKKAKKKSGEAYLNWFVISQEIEEIDVLVTHWQGIVDGAGVFRAAIPVARYDAILTELPLRELENFIVRARRAVCEIQESQDINQRFIGIEEIKELASDLLRKAIY